MSCHRVNDLELYAGSPSPSLYLALLVKSIPQVISLLFHSSISFAISFEGLKVSLQILLAKESKNQNSINVLSCF